MKCNGRAFHPATGECARPVVAVIETVYRADGFTSQKLVCEGHALAAMKSARGGWANHTTKRLRLSEYRGEVPA